MKKFLLIDLFNLVHRAYHALPKEFSDSQGNPTNAVYGVSSMLINVLQQLSPEFACAVLDTKEPTFRHVEFTGYKAHRRPMEDSLSVQIPKVLEIVKAFGIKMVSSPGYEADDVVGTLAVKNQAHCQVIILSNDRDLWQLVGKNILVMLPSTKGDAVEWVGEKEVVAKLGIMPRQVPDYKGLVGDASDNIPGVYGVGSKGASKLIAEFGSVEGIYNYIDRVSPESLQKKLLNGYEQAVMSKRLAILDVNTPVNFSLSDSLYGKMPLESVVSMLESYNFKSLLKRVLPKEVKSLQVPGGDTQKGLFD